jgi:gamma-glutamyltranspeptidase/glutathione hydrolase
MTMPNTPRSARGMVTTPHHLASQSGLTMLRAGGSAIEAVVAAAATLAVVYPHMSGLGGDGFWLLREPGRDPVGICAAGRAGMNVDADLYRRNGCSAIPTRGPLAANTVAGAVDGWRVALQISQGWGHEPHLYELFRDAIDYAEHGVFVTCSQAQLTREGFAELADLPGFADAFLEAGACPLIGARLSNPALACTFRRLADAGLDDFYRGALAADIAADLARVGAPITAADLSEHYSESLAPMVLDLPGVRLFNLPPPTQGVASLVILALLSRLGVESADSFAHLHGVVEATKLAFGDRNRYIGDPAGMTIDPASMLDPAYLDRLAARIDRRHARPWKPDAAKGDTVWLAAIDAEGRAVSYIQSIYYDFGSGVVLPQTGILWQNRGTAFTLGGHGPRALKPRALPFHTLNPAMAEFGDGRTMVYGAMGGDGQPQTQAAIFSRYAMFGQELQAAVTTPRWLLGRRWADEAATLKLEDRFDAGLVEQLRSAGHEIEIVEPFSDLMGHAGAIVRHASGVLEGAADPRSDGAVCAW